MTEQLIYTPAPTDEDFVELANVGKGRIFKKMIFRKGDDFVDPRDPLRKKKIKVTDEFGQKLAENFQSGYCDIVQLPVVDGKNAHTEDPMRNGGRIIDVENTSKGIYAIIDARKPEVADELGNTLIGASAMFHPDYVDTKTGNHVGPTLLHVAVTNRPFITQLDGFEEMVAASAADNGGDPIFLATAQQLDEMDEDLIQDPTAEGAFKETEMPKTAAELIEELKTAHPDEFAALTAPATAPAEVPAELSNALQLSNSDGETLTLADVAEAVVELSNRTEDLAVQLSASQQREHDLLEERAVAEVDDLIASGRVLPKSKDVMVRLSMDDRDAFDALVPESAIVSLSEAGVTTHDAPQNVGNKAAQADDYAARINKTYTSKK